MNKAELVEALTTRIGDRRTAAAAVDGLVEVIVETVGAGRSVTLTGFGVFEPRRRAARVARNPRTGETVPVPETVVPSFRPGAAFRDQIGRSKEAAAGATSAPRRSPRNGVAVDAAPAARSRSASGTATKAAPRSRAGTAAKAAPKATAKPAARSSAAKTASKGTATKTTAARTTTPKAAAKTTAAKAATARTTAAKAASAGTTAAKATATAKAPAKRAGRSKA